MEPNTCIYTGDVQKGARKRNVTVTIRADLVEFAKKNNINMSRLLEEALKALYFGRSVVLGPGPGFEPGLGDPQSPVLTRLHHPGHVHFSYLGYLYKLFARICSKSAENRLMTSWPYCQSFIKDKSLWG